jgi:hypothetical protein
MPWQLQKYARKRRNIFDPDGDFARLAEVYRTCDLSGSLRWLMRMGDRPATSTHTGAGEPVEVYDAGVSGAAGLLRREHAGLCPGRGPSGPMPSGDARLTEGRRTPWKSCSTGSPV